MTQRLGSPLVGYDPYYSVPGHENLFNKQVEPDNRIWQQKTNDWLNEQGRYWLGPHGESLFGILGTAAQFSDAADLSDAMTYSGEMGRAIRDGNWSKAGMTAPWAVLATGAAMLPGVSMGAADNVAKEATEHASKGIRAYHGSPHDFDRFDMSKIGTGEGAQAYGHGLYFAEAEPVAKGYRDALTRKNPVHNQIFSQTNASDLYRGLSSKDQATLDKVLGKIGDAPSLTSARNDVSKMGADAKRIFDERLSRFLADPNPGKMYEVNINADPESFLDWDKPLSEQPDVQAKLATIGEAARSTTSKGMDKYISLENMLGNPAAVTDKLREAGIPGIKYLDAGSRAKGDGSRNYVVFDENLIEILRKYGLLGIPGGTAAYMATQQDKNQTEY